MLRVTVELWPGGRESGRRVLATANIGRVKSGVLADYKVELYEDVQGRVSSATMYAYPRLASGIWDLVARALTIALAGNEVLPPRPQQLDVPIRDPDGVSYVRLGDIPEPARTLFEKRIATSSRPVIEEDSQPIQCAYASDWLNFLSGT
ncbi:hypothetical protein [Caballeronia sp. LjRoot31]|uniref:hypothetical protein n=1 Tax=Caballeronia sp. LjRoot31 TaxID=3342324 RepID=UPI003ECEAAD8